MSGRELRRPVRNTDLWIELDELVAIQKADRKQLSSWPDGRLHAALRRNLGADYVPPNPQGGLFDGLDGGEDDDKNDPG